MSEEKTNHSGDLAQFGEPDQYGDMLGIDAMPGIMFGENPGAGPEAPDPDDDNKWPRNYTPSPLYSSSVLEKLLGEFPDSPRPIAVSVNRGPNGRNFWSLEFEPQPIEPDLMTRLFGSSRVSTDRPSHYLKDLGKSFQEVLKGRIKVHMRPGVSLALGEVRPNYPWPLWKRVLGLESPSQKLLGNRPRPIREEVLALLDRGFRLFLGV